MTDVLDVFHHEVICKRLLFFLLLAEDLACIDKELLLCPLFDISGISEAFLCLIAKAFGPLVLQGSVARQPFLVTSVEEL